MNLDDQMFEHPKIVKLSDGAFRLHISAIGYCNRYLTDGIIHADVVPRLMPRFRPSYLRELLGDYLSGYLSNGSRPLWMEHPEGYEIRDYLEWNSSRVDVEKRRLARASAGRKGAHKRWEQP